MIREPGRPGHHHLHLFQNHRWAVAGASAMYVLAGVLFLVFALDDTALQPIDDWWRDVMVDAETGVLSVLAKVFDVIGGSFVTWPLWVLLSVYLYMSKRFALLLTWVISIGLAEIAIGSLKALYDRPRPLDPIVETSGAAFPSGHATAGAVTAVALVIVLIAPGEHRRVWEVRAGLFAFTMALSRTYLRAHWLTDTVAGALLGAAIAVSVAAVVHLVRVRMHLEAVEP